MDGLERLAAALGVERGALLAQTQRIVHGTTVATNALLERKGAKVGLLTTEGHRDVLEMREGLKDDRYDLRQPPPEPLVPRDRRFGVRERIRADGRIETPLDEASLIAAIAGLERSEVEAVAVCYLHAWRDPRARGAHRRRPARGAARRLRLAVRRGAAPDQGVRAGLHDGRERLCRAGARALPRPARGAPPGRGVRRADPDRPIPRRPRDDRRFGPARGGRGAVRPRGRRRRQPPWRAPDRAART